MLGSNFSFFIKIIVALICSFIISGCDEIHRNKTHSEVSNADIIRGKKLAIKYCQSCHSFPDPALLDVNSWEEGVLPAMGPRLGILSFNFQKYPSSRFDKNLEPGFYPSKPVITVDEWRNIRKYYIATSPDSLLDNHPVYKINSDLPGFEVFIPTLNYSKPTSALVQIIEQSPIPGLIVHDAQKHSLYRFNSKLEIVDSIRSRGTIVGVEINDNKWTICDIGIMTPNNGKYGNIGSMNVRLDGKLRVDSNVIINGLARPVQFTSTDFNKDGKSDFLICEFGYMTGALSWMENKGNGKYSRHVLRPLPGAIRAYINDYNNDGLPDIWVLFAQGEEGIFLYTNQGNGKFEEKKLLGFPPAYGSSYFELVDYNKDGYPDIVYTCGDNADYSNVLKPYHGVYLFINNGNNNFTQKYFFHINGCFKSITRDFDNDGDLDIATISFFADYIRRPEEGFVYLENKNNKAFTPYTFPEAKKGRWLTMDAGDINGDGKIDLVLGNFSVGAEGIKAKADWKNGPPFIVLQNIGRKTF